MCLKSKINYKKWANILSLSFLACSIGAAFLFWPEESDEVKAQKAKQAEVSKAEAELDWAAKQTCGAWIKSVANHPSTVDLHMITGSNVTVAPNGRRIVFLIFDAKNSFGLELRKKALCLISPQGEFIEASITE